MTCCAIRGATALRTPPGAVRRRRDAVCTERKVGDLDIGSSGERARPISGLPVTQEVFGSFALVSVRLAPLRPPWVPATYEIKSRAV